MLKLQQLSLSPSGVYIDCRELKNVAGRSKENGHQVETGERIGKRNGWLDIDTTTTTRECIQERPSATPTPLPLTPPTVLLYSGPVLKCYNSLSLCQRDKVWIEYFIHCYELLGSLYVRTVQWWRGGGSSSRRRVENN